MRSKWWALLAATAALSCTDIDDDGPADVVVGADAPIATDLVIVPDQGRVKPDTTVTPQDVDPPPDVAPDSGPDTGPDVPEPSCPAGMKCVDAFPYSDQGDTTTLPDGQLDFYACKPTADETGPEQVYRVTVPADGFLSAAVYDDAGVDVDVHILSELDSDACLDRGDRHARADVSAGVWYVVVDTWVDKDGVAQAGAYQVDIGFVEPSVGPCNMQTGIMKRVNDGGNHLVMPATGPIVLEAHLVTQEEPKPYPATSTDELAEHYALSQAATKYVMHRKQVWAPLEGGSFYGAGIGSPDLFPVIDESWYVNMYWTKASRPDRGTRMIVRLPGTDRAVVVAAGYETGPGNLAHIGGTPEETHFYLSTGHLSEMTLGIAGDQSLPFGPRRCVDEPPGPEPTRYPTNRVHSPVSPSVFEMVTATAFTDPLLQPDVFMKVGASSTVSSHNLACVPTDKLQLGAYDELQPTVDYFTGGDAAGTTPFQRKTLAAKSGMSVGWVMSGDPSPLEKEIDAIAPTIAMVHYGANDMQLGTTFQSAIWGFGTKLWTLADILIDTGVVPVMWTIQPRTDLPTAKYWVPTYNLVIRAVAQAFQVPFVDLHLALQDLDGFGLSGDGLHLNIYNADGPNACDFTSDGLEFGYNVRNLIAVQSLDIVQKTVADAPPLEAPVPLLGTGAPDDPFVIDSLPFTDLQNTALSTWSNLDKYTGCNADQDESGPELLYRLELKSTTRLRALVFDRGEVDVDIHLLDQSAATSGCIERDHQIIQGTFGPGVYHFALDTFVSGGKQKSGEYLFVVLSCEDGDPACD